MMSRAAGASADELVAGDAASRLHELVDVGSTTVPPCPLER